MPIAFEIRIDEDTAQVSAVSDTELEQALLSPYAGKRYEPKIVPEQLIQRYQGAISLIWQAVEEAAQKAPPIAWQKRSHTRLEKIERMERDLRYEVAYFRSISSTTKGSERSDALNELDLRDKLIDCIRNEVCTLDSIALISGERKKVKIT